MQIRKGGEWRAIQSCKIRKGNAWRSIVQIKIYASGAWREVANFTQPRTGGSGSGGGGTGTGGTGGTGGGAINLAISPSPFSKAVAGTLVSVSLTATPTGGRAPYTYLWTVVTSTTPITFSAATAATTNVMANVALGQTKTCTLRCTVTDSLGTTAHADVSGTFESIDPNDTA